MVIEGVVYDIEENPISGIYRMYYPNGSVKMEVESKNGMPNGEGKFYDENDVLSAECNFSKGLLDGAMVRYYPDGKIHEKLNYKEGVLSGKQESYDEKGNVFMEIDYDNGHAVKGYVIIDGKQVDLTAEELKNFE